MNIMSKVKTIIRYIIEPFFDYVIEQYNIGVEVLLYKIQ